MLNIITVKSKEDLDITGNLFMEYLEFLKEYHINPDEISWFDEYYQVFEMEINNLPGKYTPPKGCIFLASYNNKPVGCVGLEPKSEDICEMQRLYIRPKYRGKGIGKKLCEAAIEQAKKAGYKYLRLNTAMEDAKCLYASLGFSKIEPYQYIPIDTIEFMELKLK